MPQELARIREHIDRVDTIIMNALAERMNLMVDVARVKKAHELSVDSEKRDQEILTRVVQIAKEEGVDSSFAEEIYESIINESKRIIKKEMKN